MARVRMRRAFLVLVGAALLVAIAAGFTLWIRYIRTRETPLDADWTAVVAVLAGDGRSEARDGPAPSARFAEPFGVAAAPDGSIYVSDGGDAQSLRRISPDGMVSTIARGFSTPSALALDRTGAVYVADTGSNAIRKVTPDGLVTTMPGRFNGPIGVAVAPDGRVIVADTYDDRIRAIEIDGTVRDVTHEPFDTPCGVAVDDAGNIYVAETGAGAIRMISPTTGISTLGPVPDDGLFRPIGIAVSADGVVYATDERGRIVAIRPGVSARVLAGEEPGFADGRGADARLRSPTAVAVVAPGKLVIAESRNALVRIVAAPSRMDLQPPAQPGVRPGFDAERFARAPLLWPIAPLVEPYEITGTLGELRGADGDRFHAGIDVHAGQGTEVVAVRNGMVSDPISTSGFGALNEAFRIGPITYVHLEVGRVQRDRILDERFVATYDDEGRLAGVRVKRGARFRAGETIGATNAFNHVHLNVGWPGEEQNPLRFRLVNFEDSVPPTIAARGVRLFREDGVPITEKKGGRVIVDGRLRIVVDAWDQVDGNEPRRRLGLYRLGYQVFNRDGTPAPGFDVMRETIVFDRLAPDPDASHVVYDSGSGIPFYGARRTRFLYVVTNTFRNGVASRGVWDTLELPPGDYTLRILAADINGNIAMVNRDVPITIAR